jgi:hypothetical protein
VLARFARNSEQVLELTGFETGGPGDRGALLGREDAERSTDFRDARIL